MTERTHQVTDQRRLEWLLIWIAKQPLPLEVVTRPFIPKRTHQQNARLWKLHTLASEVTGYTPDEMHDLALCKKYGYTERECKNPFTGEIEMKMEPLERSSTKDIKRFNEFMEATERWYGEEFGVWLPND